MQRRSSAIVSLMLVLALVLVPVASVTVVAQEQEPNDDFSSAQLVSEGNTTGRIENGESDFYRIEANETDALDLRVTADDERPLGIVLYGPNRQELVSDFDATFGSEIDITRKLPENGTYYIEVTGEEPDTTQEYTLNVERITPSENDQFAPNDDFRTAASATEGPNEATIWGGESDFYRIEANETDALDLRVTADDERPLGIVLYGPNRQELVSDFDATFGSEIDITRKLPENGTYYIEVTGEELETTQEYVLNVDRVTPSENDQFAPNDDFQTAAEITTEFSEARIVGGESDFYKVGLNESEAINLEVVNADDKRPLGIVLYGPDRQELVSDFDATFGSDLVLSYEADMSGTYYVEVTSEELETTQEYTLRSNRTGVPEQRGPVERFDENGDGQINNTELLEALAVYDGDAAREDASVNNLELLDLLAVYNPTA